MLFNCDHELLLYDLTTSISDIRRQGYECRPWRHNVYHMHGQVRIHAKTDWFQQKVPR